MIIMTRRLRARNARGSRLQVSSTLGRFGHMYMSVPSAAISSLRANGIQLLITTEDNAMSDAQRYRIKELTARVETLLKENRQLRDQLEKWMKVRSMMQGNLRRGMAQSDQTKWGLICDIFDEMEVSGE